MTAITETVSITKSGPDSEIDRLDKRARNYQTQSRSDATKSAYQSDWANFEQWCWGTGLCAVPAESSTVRRYITHLADIGRAVSTISRAMTSISQAHRVLNLPPPTAHPEVCETWKGIRRAIGTAQIRAKPLVLADLKRVIDAMRPNFLGRRDSALLLIGWAAALRRSEIVALRRHDIDFVPEGMVITIRRSKTDQTREGYRIGIPFAQEERYCPTKAIQKWIDLARIDTGPLFFRIGMGGKRFHCDVPSKDRETPLSDRMVNLIIRKAVGRAKIPTAGYTGHSLRAGFVTTAAKAQIPEALIQLHTRHKTSKVLRDYIRDGDLFNSNPLSIIS